MSEKILSKRLNTTQAASYLGMAVQSMHNLRYLRRGPNYIKIGRRVLYDTKDLDSFLESNRIDLNGEGASCQ